MKIIEEVWTETKERKKITVDNYCCKKMKKALNMYKDKESGWMYNKNYFRIENIKGIMVGTHSNNNYGYKRMSVHFCPFCGERIE